MYETFNQINRIRENENIPNIYVSKITQMI